jgi:hypothetical protein
MKYDGINWGYVGGQGFSPGDAFGLRIAFNTSGQPHVAFGDGSASWKASVMKFDGTGWVYVGNAGFSETTVGGISFAFSPSGQPYVAYNDLQFPPWWGKATVVKYDSVFTGIGEPNNTQLSLYPNPTSNSITLDCKSFPANLKYIEIEDLKGIRMFETQTYEKKVVLDVENYPTGIYFVKVKTESSTWVGKFCKD